MTVINPAKPAGRGFRVAGGLVLALAAVLLMLWLGSRSTDPHGAVFLLGAGVFFGLVGASFWTIGYSLSVAGRRQG
jgi:hypothetical protein